MNNGRTVLVTGYDGYIGTVLVQKLQARGYSVRGLDTGFFADAALSPYAIPNEIISKDVRDATIEDLTGVDAVIGQRSSTPHAAASGSTNTAASSLIAAGTARRFRAGKRSRSACAPSRPTIPSTVRVAQ